MTSSEPLQLLGALLGAAATLTMGVEHKFIRGLKSREAFCPETAVANPGLNPIARWRVFRLKSAGAVRTTESGAFYLDRPSYRAYRKRRILRAGTAAVLAVAVVVAFRFW